MNKYKKFTLLMAAMAVTASSAFASNNGDVMKDSFIMPENSQATMAQVANNRYGLDFTKAAESTINSVVSIKVFATRQQQFFGNDFIDPFEFFFGPGYGGQQLFIAYLLPSVVPSIQNGVSFSIPHAYA